ncbi:MAG: hypothetical protein CMJ54_08320 [Planctomycetaceae bacterium]|nr:hypothetical protein [Planctomycetaceae bacterium]
MNVRGPIPINAAAAYGLGRPTPVKPTADPATLRAAGTVDVVDIRSTPPAGMRSLVAGTVRSDVNRGVGFDGDPKVAPNPRPTPPSAGPLHLYTSQADRIEAATGVEIGRHLDLEA